MTSYGVEQRTCEIGIRMALGARGSQVSTVLFGELARLFAVSAALGGRGRCPARSARIHPLDALCRE